MEYRISNIEYQFKELIKGFSIIELLISIALLSIVMIITTQTLTSSLKNTGKSDSISKTRVNVDYALSTMERLLRNAQLVTCPNAQTLNYIDEFGTSTSFRCINSGDYIASGSGSIRITSTDVNIFCDGSVDTFQCTDPSGGVPGQVTITLKAEDANLAGSVEGSVVESQTKVLLRNYTTF